MLDRVHLKLVIRAPQVNKHKYSMAQNDIVLGLGRPMYGTSVHANRKKAYPSVITTLGQMEKEARQWIAIHNFMCRGIGHANHIKKQYLNVLCADSVEKLDDPDESRLYVAHGIKASATSCILLCELVLVWNSAIERSAAC